MGRSGKYFLRHLLWLEDCFCDYYVQSDFWGRPEILDVEYVIFNYREDAAYWMVQCAKWDPHTTIRRLRSFLAKKCLTQYQVHRMNDRQVMRTTARELCMNAYRVVIKPKMGWAVRVDLETQEPVQPIAVSAAADLDGLLDELKIRLDAMVADRQRQTEQLNAKLAEMNAFEKSWELQKRTFKSAPQYLPLRNAVDALRALPDTVKTMGKLLATGGNILDAVTNAVRAGGMEPIQSEIKQAVAPLVETAEQARPATAMVQVLLDDKETYALLYDFGERYVKAMHPLDIAEYGLKAASVIITLIASIAAMIYTGGTSGANTAGKLLISIQRLREASPVVDKIYKALKCVAYRFKLPKLKEKVAKVKRKVTKNKGKGDVPEAKTPDKIDKNRKKGYSGDDDGRKTATNKKKPKAAQEEAVEKPVYKNKEFPTTTKPTGQRGGKPFGERTTNKPNASPEYKRSIKRENEAADLLANEGYKVEQNPVVKGTKDPDYRIEGKIFDCYAPKTDNPRSIITHIADEKIGKKQTERIVLNLADSDVKRHALRQTLNDAPIDGLKEIIVIDKYKNIIRFFP